MGRRRADIGDRLGLPSQWLAPRGRAASHAEGKRLLKPAVLGIAGWSGAGKTSLIVSVLPLLLAARLSVSTIKHAHHGAELDKPGKDSWRHRQAGAGEVLVVAPGRWALMHEEPAAEWGLSELLARMGPADLILVEGFRQSDIAKLEVYRPSLGKPPLWPDWPDIAAVATDEQTVACDRIRLSLNEPGTIATWIVAFVHSHLTAA